MLTADWNNKDGHRRSPGAKRLHAPSGMVFRNCGICDLLQLHHFSGVQCKLHGRYHGESGTQCFLSLCVRNGLYSLHLFVLFPHHLRFA